MLNLLRAGVFISATVALTGCGTLILDADFDQFNGAVGSPVGSVPGPPAGDFIIAQGDARFAKIAGNALILYQPGAGTSTGGYTGRLYLGTAAVDDTDTRRSIAWTGRFTGDTAFDTAPFAVDIGAQDSANAVDSWSNKHLRIYISNSDVELRDSSGNILKQPEALPLSQDHSVFVSLRPADASYRISIKHPAQPEILWTGALPNDTLNLLTSKPRIILRLGFPEGVSSTSVSSYAMDDVIIRDRGK